MDNLVGELLGKVERLMRMISGGVGDIGLELFLEAMDGAVWLSKEGVTEYALKSLDGYHKNILGIDAVYAFQSKDGQIEASLIIKDDDISVEKDRIVKPWTINVSFKDVPAFWKFVRGGGENILDSVLENDVEVYGNVSHLNKFGFMSIDLEQRAKRLVIPGD
jgi:hypothetical protein